MKNKTFFEYVLLLFALFFGVFILQLIIPLMAKYGGMKSSISHSGFVWLRLTLGVLLIFIPFYYKEVRKKTFFDLSGPSSSGTTDYLKYFATIFIFALWIVVVLTLLQPLLEYLSLAVQNLLLIFIYKR